MMDREERELFTKGVQDAVARRTGAALDAALAELGWSDALAQDERTAVSVLFEAQGRAAATSGALDLVLSRALGEEPASVVLPPFSSPAPPARRADDGSLTVAGLLTAASDTAHVVSTGDEGGLALATVTLDDLSRRVIGGLDPTMGMVEVTGSLTGATTRATPSTAWEDAMAAGQRALAHELVGASAAMLERAREHALDRIQFDVPIASFQAVRHKLADTYVAVEAARAALDSAWDAGTGFDASAAKAVAGRTARLAAKHCQQVLAGIGFTTEHDLHRYVKRVRVLDGLLGDSRSLTRAIGERLLRDHGLPGSLPL